MYEYFYIIIVFVILRLGVKGFGFLGKFVKL